jgi:uracil-DNA glycosylase family 4
MTLLSPPPAPARRGDHLGPAGRDLATLAAAIQGCRCCQAAGHLAQAEPHLLGLAHRLTVPTHIVLPGSPRLMVIGQAPGRHAGRYREPFTSPYSRTIAAWLTQAGFARDDLSARVHLTALTRCFPGPSPTGHGDRAPSRAEVALCAPHLRNEIALLQPAVILPVGKLAIDTLYGRSRPLSQVIGTAWERDGVRYLPLPHPSGVSRWRNDPAHRALVDDALALLAAWRVELAL